MSAPLAKFDSASAMAAALGRFLHGRDFPAVGSSPALVPLAKAANLLPGRARAAVFSVSGALEALDPAAAADLDAEAICEWFVRRYPRRRYPGAFVGSSSGALVHLAAALGWPWLPQTALVPVDLPDMDPDEPRRALESGREIGRRLLDRNPDWQLHHMHDPNEDRLMLRRMGYFRVKRRRLGPVYARFLDEVLEPGGTLVLVECMRRWPVTGVGPRHFFQFGAVGGATERQYFEGGPEVRTYLARYGVGKERWDPPAADLSAAEAEWGFEPSLAEDVRRYAEARGHRVRRVAFADPDHLSPLVADLHRWWYRRRGLPDRRRLVAESFILLEPYWTVRTGSVPFWMTFNMEPSAAALESYLDRAGPFDEIHLGLFPHGVESIGLSPLGRWRGLLARARGGGSLLGVDERAFPADFAALGRFHQALKALRPHLPRPEPLAMGEVDEFLAEVRDRHPVRWE